MKGRGQSLPEYVLAGALICLLVLPALLALGGGLSEQVASFNQALVARPEAVKHNAATPPATPPTSGLPSGLSSGISTDLSFTTSQGTVIHLPGYTDDLSTTVATVGANGTTSMLAGHIQRVAQQMLDSGSITEAQYGSLMALANQGHHIAELERVLENTLRESKDEKYPWQIQIPYGGEEHSLDSFRRQFGFQTGISDPNHVPDPLTDTRAYPELRKFQRLYQEAVNSGALQDPNARKVVETLARDIAYLSEVVTCIASDIVDGLKPAGSMTEPMASMTSHRKSAGICTQGQHADSGIHCTDG